MQASWPDADAGLTILLAGPVRQLLGSFRKSRVGPRGIGSIRPRGSWKTMGSFLGYAAAALRWASPQGIDTEDELARKEALLRCLQKVVVELQHRYAEEGDRR